MGAARDRTTTRHTVDRHILGRGVPMSTNAELFDQAKKVIPGGVDSPVRAYGSVGGVPRFIDHAQGPWIWDAEGHRYVDLVCTCLLYTSPSPRDLSTSRMPSSA